MQKLSHSETTHLFSFKLQQFEGLRSTFSCRGLKLNRCVVYEYDGLNFQFLKTTLDFFNNL